MAPTASQVADAIAGRFGPVPVRWRFDWRSHDYDFLGDVTPAVMWPEGGDGRSVSPPSIDLDNDRAVLDAACNRGRGHYLDFDLQEQTLNGKNGHELHDGHFDIAFCLSTLQHIKNPDAVLRDLTQIADEIYIEVPSRFVTDYMASVLSTGELLGESERGRPIYRVKVKEAVPA